MNFEVMNGKSLWVRTFLVAVGILATMGMNINRINTIGGFDNAAENNTHLLDGSYESGGLLDGSMDRMPYDLGGSFDVRNDSITNSYIRDSINSGMDLPQVMDMKSEISRFKRDVAPTLDTKDEGDDLLKKDTYNLIDKTHFLRKLTEHYKSISKNIKILSLSNVEDQLVLKQHLDNTKSILSDCVRYNCFEMSFSTLNRRQNLKTITFALVDTINTIDSMYEAYKSSTDYKPSKSIETYTNELSKLAINTLINFMSMLQSECVNHEGYHVDYFNVNNFTCNPTCGIAIDPNVTHFNSFTSEYSESNKGMLTLYDKDNNRCNSIRAFSDICINIVNKGIYLVDKYATGNIKEDSSNTKFIQYVTQVKEKLYNNLNTESWCLALDSCCYVRIAIKKLSKASLKIDTKYGIEGSNAPANVHVNYYTSLRKLSNLYKDIIIKLLTKIVECRTHSVSNKKDFTQKKSGPQEAHTTTVSTGDQEPSEIDDTPGNQKSSKNGEVTNHGRNLTSGNNQSNVGDGRTDDTQLKNDPKLQSNDGSSLDKIENVAASSGYLHSSVASNTLVSSLFILIATLLQQFQ